jgi:hypothetical protein
MERGKRCEPGLERDLLFWEGWHGRARLSAPSKRLEIKFARERMRGTVIPDDVVRVHELISEARFKNMRFEFDWMVGKFKEIDNAGQAVRLRWSIISPVVPGRYLNPLPGLTDSGASVLANWWYLLKGPRFCS